MIKGKLNVVLDGQWGSTGKGKLCAWLAVNHDVNVAMCDFQTNAGHTVVKNNGEKFVLQQLPVAAINQDTQLLIAPVATIDVNKLLEEVETHKAYDRLTIHPNAGIITDECKNYEKENLKRISSTLKGCGAATGMKAMRHPNMKLAKDVPELKHFIGDTTELIQMYLKSGMMCLMETAQGFDLSLNFGHVYPYVTSRDVTTASALNNAGVPPQVLGDVYGSIRTYPIRVGNVIENGIMTGYSGDYYPDQTEISWEDLKGYSGSNKDITEITTVTKKVRRVFTFSRLQFKKFINVCSPTHIFLNFINHINETDFGKRTYSELSIQSVQFINDLIKDVNLMSPYQGVQKTRITHIGTGDKMSDMIVINE